MRFAALFCVLTCLLAVGCGEQAEPIPEMAFTPIPEAELQPTLEEIAETGDYGAILTDLTAGLEQAGHMQAAAMVQQFPSLQTKEEVKQHAQKIAASLGK